LHNFGRLFACYGQRDFSLEYSPEAIEEHIELIGLYDHDKSKQESMATLDDTKNVSQFTGATEHNQSEQDISVQMERPVSQISPKKRKEGKNGFSFSDRIRELLLRKYETRKSRKENCCDPMKVLLHRHFVNALIRAIHLKTGSITNLPSKIDKYVRTRMNPIIVKEIRPKVIIGDDKRIVERSKRVMAKFEQQFAEIYGAFALMKGPLQVNDTMDLYTLLHLLKVKNFPLCFLRLPNSSNMRISRIRRSFG
jgi:hypothetical protein